VDSEADVFFPVCPLHFKDESSRRVGRSVAAASFQAAGRLGFKSESLQNFMLKFFPPVIFAGETTNTIFAQVSIIFFSFFIDSIRFPPYDELDSRNVSKRPETAQEHETRIIPHGTTFYNGTGYQDDCFCL